MGARKANSPGSCLMPMSTEFQRKFYFHQHIMTVLQGDEFDRSAHFIRAPELETDAADTAAPTVANKRKALSVLATDSERPIINERVSRACKPRAKFLQPFSDSQLRTKASAALEAIDLTDDYTLGTVSGCDMYASTHDGGRKCTDNRHHGSNRFFVRFLQSGRMQYHCHGRPCCKEPALEIGDWVMSLADLLNSSVWAEGTVINEALLKHLQNLVEQIGEGKSGAARQEWFRLNSPQWRRLELTVTRYLNRFIVDIREDDLYVVKQLQHGSTILDEFTVYSSNKFKAAFQASAWAITVWQHSTAKSVKQRLAGNPYRERVASNEFNLLAGAMPLLDLPDRELTEAEELALKDILHHILNSLVSGNQQDYDIFMDWMAYVAQNPDRKIAYMPFFVGDEGTGKGVIITKLLLPMFGAYVHLK